MKAVSDVAMAGMGDDGLPVPSPDQRWDDRGQRRVVLPRRELGTRSVSHKVTIRLYSAERPMDSVTTRCMERQGL